MRRREFIRAIGGAALFPLAARAQDSGRTYRLGSLQLSARTAPWHAALFDALRRQGFIEGQNLLADPNGYSMHVEQLAEHASEVVKANVDIIICAGEPPVRAAKQATKAIPILAIAEDMVGSGFVVSLAKPGGNITGVSILTTELDGKRQEILIEASTGIRRMAALADPNSTSPPKLQALQDSAHARGVELSIHRASKPEEIASAIDAAKNSGAEALNVLASAFLFNTRQIILPHVAALRLPAIYQWPEITEEGGLMGYGPHLVQIYGEIWSRQLAQLLRGTKPADIPIEQPTKFDLAVNLKTAKSLSLTFSESFLQRADNVIE
jgi:putative ABC transport system substrate-binding protein